MPEPSSKKMRVLIIVGGEKFIEEIIFFTYSYNKRFFQTKKKYNRCRQYLLLSSLKIKS